MHTTQLQLFDAGQQTVNAASSSTFTNNMKLPVHRWFRYSAGFSASWAESVIAEKRAEGEIRVLDPFAGSGTTLLCAEDQTVESIGIESHPFVARIARAKLLRRSDPDEYREFATGVLKRAKRETASVVDYGPLIHKCYHDDALADLDRLRRAFEAEADGSVASELTWLTLVAILRRVSHVGTAQWQYVLPNKTKKNAASPYSAFREVTSLIYRDMIAANHLDGPNAKLIQGDARACAGVPDRFANLVVTSPPYPNNYDYADATRLEMTFMGEINGWGDLQQSVRRFLVRSCSQHVPERAVNLEEVLAAPELAPITDDIEPVCRRLAEVRQSKGGKKTYHLMVACYFLDLAQTWLSLRRVCDSPSLVCFVIGDSAPYGVYVPVADWLGRLAVAAGFRSFRFEKTRDRNVKWKNRKHRVPLCEGRLWVEG
jgi:DNA methylase